ncbi:MAG: leucine-rich repeat domain-containing protein, partial [Spirochaetia bacterium]|nr:leucine-rich repeat domain-containing protein [Spirochaetia bacterium]
IEDDAFAGCDKLVELYIPDSVRSIGFGAFAYCNSLRNVSLPEGVSISGKGVFAKCGLNSGMINRRSSE